MQFAYICVNMCVRVHVHMLVCLHAHAVIFDICLYMHTNSRSLLPLSRSLLPLHAHAVIFDICTHVRV
jgi:hypothetical protein